MTSNIQLDPCPDIMRSRIWIRSKATSGFAALHNVNNTRTGTNLVLLSSVQFAQCKLLAEQLLYTAATQYLWYLKGLYAEIQKLQGRKEGVRRSVVRLVENNNNNNKLQGVQLGGSGCPLQELFATLWLGQCFPPQFKGVRNICAEEKVLYNFHNAHKR